MKNLFSLTIILLSLSSCDKFMDTTVYIDNRTSETLIVSYPLMRPSFECSPDTITTFYQLTTRTVKNFPCDPYIKKDSIKIRTNTGKALKKEIWNKNNWICIDRTNASWEMTFIVTEEDLE